MKRTMVLTIFLICIPYFLAAQSAAVVKEFEGRVLYMESGADWKPVAVGSPITLGTTISTGFKSSALLDLGTSEITVKALTSLTLDDLITEGGTVKTSLSLNVGRVNAKVKTGEELTHDFTLKSSFSTAAVRGTEFDYDGERISALKGVVLFYNLIGQTRTLTAGQKSATSGYETPELAELEDIAVSLIIPDPMNLARPPMAPEAAESAPVTVILE